MWWMYHAAARVGLINTLSEIIIIGGKFYLETSPGMTGRFVSMTFRFNDEFRPSLRRGASK